MQALMLIPPSAVCVFYTLKMFIYFSYKTTTLSFPTSFNVAMTVSLNGGTVVNIHSFLAFLVNSSSLSLSLSLFNTHSQLVSVALFSW